MPLRADTRGGLGRGVGGSEGGRDLRGRVFVDEVSGESVLSFGGFRATSSSSAVCACMHRSVRIEEWIAGELYGNLAT